MNSVQIYSTIIFIVAIVLIATERVHKMYAALLAALGMVLIGAVKPQEILGFIDIEILGVIFGIMLLVNGAEKTGIFRWLAVRILRVSKSPKMFAVIMLVFTAFLSLFLNNIGAMLICASMTIVLTRALKMRPEMLLVYQAIVVNQGGMILLMSSIPNIIVAVAGGLSFKMFLFNMAPLGVILIIVTVLIFLKFYFADSPSFLCPYTATDSVEELVTSELEPDITIDLRNAEFKEWIGFAINELGPNEFGWKQAIASIIVTGTVVLFAFYDVLGLTPAFVSLMGGFFMVAFSEKDPTRMLRETDWSTLIFLAGLFVSINGLNKVGVIDALSVALLDLAGRYPERLHLTVMWLSALVSSIIDNIPMTATFTPIIERWIASGLPPSLWWSLVVGANLGGNLTPIGSPSNIIVLGVSEREGCPISIIQFFKICLTVTLVQLLISMVYLSLLNSL
jgi:Na+/H+ antiporter NhaD/arsenite permease-like protein